MQISSIFLYILTTHTRWVISIQYIRYDILNQSRYSPISLGSPLTNIKNKINEVKYNTRIFNNLIMNDLSNRNIFQAIDLTYVEL